MANETIDKEEYKLIDFNGEIPWLRLPNGTYAVDPLYENKFKSIPIK
ncbi:hypothetical protein [Pelosinus sp. UFO1]|nr:hypothetical protein [Pelosinus sp. UFO1]AIF52049.1 hypothetical protein UFO1_2502 [Pelosinus sp. UFO1]